MNQHTSTAIWGSFASIAVGAALVAMAYFSSTAWTAAHVNGTQRIEACVENGGTWLSINDSCLNSK